MPYLTRVACAALDAADPLTPLRGRFDLDAADQHGEIYLDGNSLGPLPRATAERVREVLHDEWGRDLIRSWNTAGWITLSQRIGDKIARLVGAGPGEIVVADSTSVNLYKVLAAAMSLAAADAPATRRTIMSERTNFPTDLYIADTAAKERGFSLALVDADDLPGAINDTTAVVMLTHVNYRTGRMHDMAAVTKAAHAAGALVVWDLAHSAGAVPVSLSGDGTPASAADFAVGCGYKYLNGGPGAPAFVWVHPAHTARMDAEGWRQPLAGWLGHAAPFAFTTDYLPGAGITRFVCGTPPVLSLAALECGVDTVLAAEHCRHGGGAAEVARAHGSLPCARRGPLRRARPHADHAGRARATRQPGEPCAPHRWLSDDAGAHCPRRHRRLPRARHPALRLHAALHALRGRVGRSGPPRAGARVRRVARGPLRRARRRDLDAASA